VIAPEKSTYGKQLERSWLDSSCLSFVFVTHPGNAAFVLEMPVDKSAIFMLKYYAT
jgi:hypothetical protein